MLRPTTSLASCTCAGDALKDGSGRELRQLHDTINQHLRALRALDYESSGPFITSMLELRLDSTTMFEWQKYSHESPKIPHYTMLQEFLNLRAQASKSYAPEFVKKRQHDSVPPKRYRMPRHVTSYAAAVDNSCVACKVTKHPLYVCPKFKSLPHEQMLATLKSNGLCINCLRPGHFDRRCASTQRCRRCQKPHHTLLHLEVRPDMHEPNPPLQSSASAAIGTAPSSTVVSCRPDWIQVSPGASHDLSCLGSHTRWIHYAGKSLTGLCVVFFICLGAIGAVPALASLSSFGPNRWHWWCLPPVTRPVGCAP